jgi:xanthine dehydrogenase accessory factor
LPEPQLLICGASPAAEALVKIGKAVGLQVFLIDPSATPENFPEAEVILPCIAAGKFLDTRERYAVVATMGNWDEEAIKDVLALSPAYLGLIASKKRFQEIVSRLSGEGVSREQLALVTCPAGLEISARTLPEVALSIMAEIVSLRRSRAEKGAVTSGPAQVVLPAMAEDPVCHMRLDPQTAPYHTDFEGLTYYFCNASCRARFEKDPRKYLAQEVRA